MNIHIITTFPELIRPYTEESILKRAVNSGYISFTFYNPRDFTTDKHHKTDDIPYGGGPGMVMKAEPIIRAVQRIKAQVRSKKTEGASGERFKIIHFSPRGVEFTNQTAKKYALGYTDIILICGRYEGVDARVRKILRGDELSIGPYVLTGGEIPALVVLDAVSRQLPGVLGNSESLEEKRISSNDVYTRPDSLEWEGRKYRVPAVLKTGDHKIIDQWRSTH